MENNTDKNLISSDEGCRTSSNNSYLLHPGYRDISRKGQGYSEHMEIPKDSLGFIPYLNLLLN